MSVARRSVLSCLAAVAVLAAAPTQAGASQRSTSDSAQAAVPAPAEAGSIAAIDLRYVASRSKAGQTAFARLDELTRRKQAEIEARSRTLIEEQRKLQQDPSFLSDSVQGQLAKAFEKSRIAFERFREDAEAEVLDLRRQIEAEFAAKVAPVVNAVAKERGLRFVFDVERAAIVWRSPIADISEEVVSRLDTEK